MKTVAFAFIGLMISFSAFASLSCQEIEKAQDEDGNINYFQEVDFRISKSSQNKLVKAAVADFYGKCGVTWNKDFCYRENMSVKEIYELGEDAYFISYKTPQNKLYLAVNVGFGGGNSATYFFDSQTFQMENIMIIDGAECSLIQSILGYN